MLRFFGPRSLGGFVGRQLLDIISLALAWPSGFPFLGPSLVFAILYYWSRLRLSEVDIFVPLCCSWGLGNKRVPRVPGREPYAKLSFFSFTIQADSAKIIRCGLVDWTSSTFLQGLPVSLRAALLPAFDRHLDSYTKHGPLMAYGSEFYFQIL